MPVAEIKPPEVIKPTYSTKESRIAYIETQIFNYDLPHDVTMYIAEHESRFCDARDKFGDMDIYRDGQVVRARGCWQITTYYHPEVSDACAFDIVCATAWAIPRLKNKKDCLREWSTCRDYYGVTQ